jgi:hypothetical protein
MEVATNGTADEFVEPTAEQIVAGTVINEASSTPPTRRQPPRRR